MTNYQIKAYRSKDDWEVENQQEAFAEMPKRSLAMAVGELMANEYGFAVVYIDGADSSSFFYRD